MFGSVSIPVKLGLAGFQQQVGVATRALQGVGLAGGTATQRVAQIAIAAKQFVSIAVPASVFASQIALSVFGMTQLQTKVAAVANFFTANYFPLPFLNPINQGILQTVVFMRQAGAIQSVVNLAVTSFTNLGFSGKLAFSTILTGGLAAAPQVMAFFLNQTMLVNQAFVTGLIPNILTVNALMTTYQSLFATGLANPVRYTDLVVLGGILKELVPKASLLGQTLNTMITPIKFGRAAQGFISYLRLLGTEVTAFTAQVNMLSTGLAASAASLIGGGSFLLPGQLSPGPTSVDMFQNQQGVEEAVQYQILTDNLRALSEVSGATSTQIENVNRSIFSVGTTTKQNIDQVANSASALKRAGVEVEAIPEAIKSLGYAASATNEDMVALSKTALDLTGAFTDLTVSTAADVLTAISVKTGIATNQLATSILNASGIAKSAGMNFRQTALIIGAMGNAGISTANASSTLEDSITSLQQIATDYRKNIKSNSTTAINSLGLSKDDIVNASGGVKSFESIIETFQSKIAEFNVQGRQSEVAPLISQIFGKQSSNEMLALFNQSSSAISDLKQSINNAGGISQKVSDTQMKSLAGTLDRLTDGARAVSITVGQFLSPVLSAFLQPVASLTEGFLRLPPALQLTALSLSVVGPLMLVVFHGSRLLVTWTKLWAAAQVVASVATEIYTGRLTALQVKQAISAQWTEIATKATQAYSFMLGVLSGQISLASARQTILNASQVFGVANANEYFNTTRAATAILGDYAKHLLIGTTNIKLFSVSELASTAVTSIKNGVINTAIALTQKQTYLNLIQNTVALAQANINAVVAGSIAAKTFVLGLFNRQQAVSNTQQSFGATISLVAAQAKNIYAIAVGRASIANVGFIGTMVTVAARFALVAAAAWAVSQAWTAFTAGQTEASGIQDAADEINKLTADLGKLNAKTEESVSGLQKFWDAVQKKGAIEATQGALAGLTGGMPDDTYGKGEGGFITNSQLTAQRAMFATENVSKAVNIQLDKGISTMQRYGVETIDVADKQRLGTEGIAKFKAEAKSQIEMLGKTVEVMKDQKPVNDEQAAVINTNIKLAEQQIKLLRGKVVALESETATAKVHILTLDELTKKYQALAAASELSSLKSAASIEEMVAKGEGRGGISQKDGTVQQRGLQQLDITQKVLANTSKTKDLKAASIGASPEDAAKISEELSKIEVDQVKARIDRAKLEQQTRKDINDEILSNTKEREDSLIAKQELAAQNQITAIKKAQTAQTISAEVAAARIAGIESTGLQQSIARETQKQQKLKQLRQWGVISEEEMRKGLRDSQSSIAKTQTQLAEAQIKRQEERAASQIKKQEERTASQIKAIEEQAKSIQAKSEVRLGGLDTRSFASEQRGKLASTQSGVADAKSGLEAQRLSFALQLAELNNNQAQQEQIKNQIYQQQLGALNQQSGVKRQELALSQQQAAIELERKRIQAESAVAEAGIALEIAKKKGGTASEIAQLQQSIALKQQIVARVGAEQVGQNKLNALATTQLDIQQKTAKEGLQQQRQIDLERQAIEKKTKAIEEGLVRARTLSEARSQKLEFKGQDVGAEIDKQKLLADISQSQTNLQKQRLEFGLQSAELAGNESEKERIKAQIYQQQKTSLLQQQQTQVASAALSREQAAIELERKRVQAEIALIEAQANVESAKAKNASASELTALQAIVGLRQSSVARIGIEEANQNKINQLTGQHLSLEQQIARENLEQQRQLELQKQAIEQRTKAIEEGLVRSRTALETKSQGLEFKGQSLTGESDKQKALAGLQEAQAGYQKQQLDFAMQRAELLGNEAAKEQIKEQIYQQQKAAMLSQQQAQTVGIQLSRQQAAIELERQKLAAQIALIEAQANLEKARATKGSSSAEIAALQAAVGYRQQAISQISQQASTQKQIQGIESSKLATEQKTTLQNLIQTRELERQKDAIEKQKKAIDDRLASQKASLENRQGKLELSNQLLDLESRKMSARSGLTEATNGLEQQRLEFLISQAEITGNASQSEQLKTQLYQQQLTALDGSQAAQQQSFEISQKQKQIELDKQEIQAKIATFEADAVVAKAKADNNSSAQINALEAVYKLRQDALAQVGQMRTAEGQIANLERQKLSVEQLSAREKLRQTNQLGIMRKAHEANNKAIGKGNDLQKEGTANSAKSSESINTSGGLSWVDKAGPAWFEGAKNPFQQAAEDYLATNLPPAEIPPVGSSPIGTIADPTKQLTPETAQQLTNMNISAQNVYLTGKQAQTAEVGNWLNDTIAGLGTSATAPTVSVEGQREAAKARVEQAQSALQSAIARQNAEGRSLTIDPAEAARQGLAAAASARDYAAQIRADLKSGALKNEVSGRTTTLNLPPTLGDLAANLASAQAALKEIKVPVTVESIYKLMGEIKEILSKQSIGNLTVVSQNPVAECGEILSALAKRR